MLKSFRGSTLEDALTKVKAEFGPAALVVNTRSLGLENGHKGFEVLAAVNKSARQPDAPQAGHALPVPKPADAGGNGRPVGREAGRPVGREAGRPVGREAGRQVKAELASIRSTLQTLTRMVSPNLPGQFGKIRDRLQSQGVDPVLALSLIEESMGLLRPAEFADPEAITQRAAAVIADKINTAGPLDVAGDSCRVVALIGPTGVGKTTTIAKLSANYTLNEKRKVGLITIDTFRVAAVEQLKAFAEMLGVPFRVVFTPSELRSAVDLMGEHDLVLIDTVGRSHWDSIRIQELKGFLQTVPQVQATLVVSSGAKDADVKDVCQTFSALCPTQLIVTKIDETTTYGGMLNLSVERQEPLCYLTNGQEVPDDIEVAESDRIAELILGDLIGG